MTVLCQLARCYGVNKRIGSIKWSLAGGDLSLLDVASCDRCDSTYSSSAPAAAAFRPLCKYVAQLGIIFVLVNVMYTNMSVMVGQPMLSYLEHGYIPL